ncbi:hypothetical protein J008_06777 [Cryptococcus neoformans]|nr:hypothetical protein C362_06751 [Cryptococcus neoformans var. grubii Bt1]OXG10588.1 hypothetical protein C367_06747 [Cryptococcus neoformans var. grubii Ze90-1]OXH21521.1 hypothetical protein J008_06777 [Cryptococcus neoformans var. grubii]
MGDNDRPSAFWLFLANLSLCLCSGHEDDPERQALYPPDTVLSAPRPRSRPRLSNLSSYGSTTSRRWPSASTSPIKSGGLTGFTDIENNVDAEARRKEGKRKMDSISKAFAERMTALDLPSQIQTPNMSFIPSLQPLSTAASNPILPTIHTARPLGSPYRPSAPHLGRSISEPRSLHDLGGFAAHHVPFGSSVIVRGLSISPGVSRGRGRARSATVGERWNVPWEGTRGRKGLQSRCPSGLGKGSIGFDEVEQEAKMDRSASPSLNLSLERSVSRSHSNSQSHSHTRPRQSFPLAGHPDQQERLTMRSCWIDPETHLHSSSYAHTDVNAQEVIRRNLGLNALYSGSATSHSKRTKGKDKGKRTRRMRVSSS